MKNLLLKVNRIIEKQKQIIKKDLSSNKDDYVLNNIELTCNLLWNTSMVFDDMTIEENLRTLFSHYSSKRKSDTTEGQECVFFLDSFGLPNRGLAFIYANALISCGKKFIYIAYKESKERMKPLEDLIDSSKTGKIIFIDNHLSINELCSLSNKFPKASCSFLYITPSDVRFLFLSYLLGCKSYLINLTDHAFWIGSQLIDYSIEFRDYGANVSTQYRGIKPSQVILLPYYSEMAYHSFRGYPSARMSSKNTIFTGGSIHKTIGKNLLYYKTINKLMVLNPNLMFWYAGSGDKTYLHSLQIDFPGRVFITSERDDLPEIMKHIRFYISSFPVTGGLMEQYAAMNGALPITYLENQMSSGILVGPNKTKFEYANYEDFFEECQKLISDDNYLQKRREDLKGLMITKKEFNESFASIVNNSQTKFTHSTFVIKKDEIGTYYMEQLNQQNGINLYLRYFSLKIKCLYPKAYKWLKKIKIHNKS